MYIVCVYIDSIISVKTNIKAQYHHIEEGYLFLKNIFENENMIVAVFTPGSWKYFIVSDSDVPIT